MLMTWDSRNWRRLKKAVGLCKDYGLTALSKRVYIGFLLFLWRSKHK